MIFDFHSIAFCCRVFHGDNVKVTKIILFAILIFLMAISTGFAIFPFSDTNILNPKNLIVIGMWIMVIALWGMTRNK